jgi:hypothetical protein
MQKHGGADHQIVSTYVEVRTLASGVTSAPPKVRAEATINL